MPFVLKKNDSIVFYTYKLKSNLSSSLKIASNCSVPGSSSSLLSLSGFILQFLNEYSISLRKLPPSFFS